MNSFSVTFNGKGRGVRKRHRRQCRLSIALDIRAATAKSPQLPCLPTLPISASFHPPGAFSSNPFPFPDRALPSYVLFWLAKTGSRLLTKKVRLGYSFGILQIVIYCRIVISFSPSSGHLMVVCIFRDAFPKILGFTFSIGFTNKSSIYPARFVLGSPRSRPSVALTTCGNTAHALQRGTNSQGRLKILLFRAEIIGRVRNDRSTAREKVLSSFAEDSNSGLAHHWSNRLIFTQPSLSRSF